MNYLKHKTIIKLTNILKTKNEGFLQLSLPGHGFGKELRGKARSRLPELGQPEWKPGASWNLTTDKVVGVGMERRQFLQCAFLPKNHLK